MKLRMLGIGFGNFVMANRLMAVISPGSAPVKRLKDVAKEKGRLVDATYGRKTRSILVMDSEHVVLSAVNPETIHHRLQTQEESLIREEDMDELDSNADEEDDS